MFVIFSFLFLSLVLILVILELIQAVKLDREIKEVQSKVRRGENGEANHS